MEDRLNLPKLREDPGLKVLQLTLDNRHCLTAVPTFSPLPWSSTTRPSLGVGSTSASIVVGRNRCKGREQSSLKRRNKYRRGRPQLILQLMSVSPIFPFISTIQLGPRGVKNGTKQIAHGQGNAWESWKCRWRLRSTCSREQGSREIISVRGGSGMDFWRGEVMLLQQGSGSQTQSGQVITQRSQWGTLC